jgi:hypothetical protein
VITHFLMGRSRVWSTKYDALRVPGRFSLGLADWSGLSRNVRSRLREGGMDTTLTLIDLAGSIALLLWGVHMV